MHFVVLNPRSFAFNHSATTGHSPQENVASSSQDADTKAAALNPFAPSSSAKESNSFYQAHSIPEKMVTNLRDLPGAHPAAFNNHNAAAEQKVMNDSKVTAEACYRPLEHTSKVVWSPIDEKLNTVIGHQHIFFSDGTNVGYSKKGIYSTESKANYSRCEPLDSSKDEIMRRVEAQADKFEPEDYKLFHNNCQHFVDAVR